MDQGRLRAAFFVARWLVTTSAMGVQGPNLRIRCR